MVARNKKQIRAHVWGGIKVNKSLIWGLVLLGVVVGLFMLHNWHKHTVYDGMSRQERQEYLSSKSVQEIDAWFGERSARRERSIWWMHFKYDVGFKVHSFFKFLGLTGRP